VVPDEVTGGHVATEALLRKGHRRVAFINGPAGWPATDGRLKGYRQALDAWGVPLDESLVRYGNGFADSGYICTKDVMRNPNPPTAIFCATDRMAMGAYDALRELGLSIPGDVAVMGYDNQELIAAYLRPGLSTMALPFFEMGQWAVNDLIHYDHHAGQNAPVQHLIECPFVQRESI
jgi:LacI family transcriptional regulator